ALHVALDRDEAGELRRRFELMDSLDLGVEWLRPRGCRELEPGLTPSCAAGVHAPGEAAVDPQALLPALVGALQNAGGELSVQAGLRPGTPDNAPLVGPGERDGLVLATGHYRNGVLMAPITAEAVAAYLAREQPPPDMEAAHPGRFAGEGAPKLAPAPVTQEAPR